MKFSDIKQFIQAGNYEVNIPLTSIERTLKRWDEDYSVNLEPDFQRGHVWTEEQQISYVEFLLRGGITSRVIYFNSPAFGSYKNFDDETIVCVDGLQRLTACRRFINNEIKVFGYRFSEFEGSSNFMNDLRFNVNSLETRAEVLEWYIQFNSGGTVHTKEEIDRVKKLLEEEVKKEELK